MKILLISPIYFFQRWPFELYGTKSYFSVEPLSLLQLAAYFPKITTVIDGMNNKSIKPSNLAEIVVKYNNPRDIIGIASHSNVGAMNTLYTLKLIKAYAPNATIIMGGYHATFYHELWIKLGADVIIRHEAEITYSNLLKKIQGSENGDKIELEDLVGTTFSKEWFNRINNQKKIDAILISNKDWEDIFSLELINKRTKYNVMKDRPFCGTLDDFPLPDRTKLDYRLNFLPFEGKGFATNIETARGCPYNCSFCSTRTMWKRTHRLKSIDRSINEIKKCIDLGIKKFLFVNESWGANPKYYNQFLSNLKQEGLDIKWGIQARTDTIYNNPELLKKAGRLGCRLALVGYENLNQNILNLSNKGTKAITYVKVRDIMKSSGILVAGFFLVGLPGETKENRRFTIKNMYNFCDIPFLQQYVPYFKGIYALNKEEKIDIPGYTKKKNPTFMLDTQHIKDTLNDRQDYKVVEKITNDIRKHHFQMLLKPKHIFEMIFSTDVVGKSKKVFLRHMYETLFRNFLRFKPQDLLYLFRGK